MYYTSCSCDVYTTSHTPPPVPTVVDSCCITMTVPPLSGCTYDHLVVDVDDDGAKEVQTNKFVPSQYLFANNTKSK